MIQVDRKKIKWFGASFLIIVILFYLADLQELFGTLRSAKLNLVVLAIFIGLIPFTVWSYTWYRLINQVGASMKYREVVPVFLGGNFLNAVTPLGQFGGEPFMAYIMSRNTELSYEKAFPAVMSSDIINFTPRITFTLTGGLLFLTQVKGTSLLQQLVMTAIGLSLVGGLATYILWFKADKFEDTAIYWLRKTSEMLGRGFNLVEKVEKKISSLEQAFTSIGSNPLYLLKTAAVVHLAFLFNILCLYICLLSLGITSELYILLFVLPLTSIASISPTPGSSGAFEGTLALILTILTGIGFSQALAAAIIFRIATFWPGLLIGYVALAKIERGSRE